MASRSTVDAFHNSWNQTAAWAQSKGAKYNDYYPIYQQDTQRLLQYGTPMSQAERERAVLAAANIGGTTQKTPSTASNPANVIGNTVTDLRNIFTGIGDIAIHPLHNGLVDSVKNTVDLLTGAHHLQGANFGAKLGDALTSTVLSWVPGTWDIGTVLKADPTLSGSAGGAALAEHPISSILDVVPLAKPLTLLKDPARAERVGMTVPEAQNATIGRVVKGYVMNTPTDKIGPEGLMTIGDRFHALTAKGMLNTNPAIAEAAFGVEAIQHHATSEERYYFDGVEKITDHMDEGQKAQLAEVWQKAQQTGLENALKDPELDPRVVEASREILDGPLRFHTEEALAASDGPTKILNPRTGQVEIHNTTSHPVVARAREDAIKATAKVLEKLPGLEKIKQTTDQASALLIQHTGQLEQANQAARSVHVDGNYTFKLGEAKRATGFSKSGISEKLFGTGGFIDKLVAKAKEGRYEDVHALSEAALKRLDGYGARSVDASQAPEFQAVRTQVENLGKAAKVMLELRKRADQQIHGRAKAWEGSKGYRDELHREQVKQLDTAHKQELRQIGQQRKAQFARLKTAFTLKKQEIRTRYATAKKERNKSLVEGTQEINDRYGIEKAKVETRHLLAREAHGEWLRGRRAQGLPGPTEGIQAAQEGTRIQPGALGSREAIQAGHDTLEAARIQELRDLEKSLPSTAALDAKMQGELRAAESTEVKMNQRLRQSYDQTQRQVIDRHKQELKDLSKQHLGKKGREGQTTKLLKEYVDAHKAFSKAVYKHPADNKVDLFFSLFAKHLVANEKAEGVLAANEKALAEKYGWGKDSIEQLRANPEVMSQLVQVGIKGVYDDPLFEGIDKGIIKQAQESALKELDKLGKEGIFPQYIPHVSESQLRADATGSYGIRVVVGKGIPKPDVMSSRTWGLDSSKYDLMAGVHRGVKQILERDAVHEYVDQFLAPHITTEETLKDTLLQYFPDQIAGLSGQGLADFMNARAKDWNLVKFDAESKFGFQSSKWTGQQTYIDKDLLKAVEKLTQGGLPNKPLYDKATRLFRYSILGLSPRYTAHIVFGGSFLLALRSSPKALTLIGDAHRQLKTGELHERLLTSPTNMGTTEYELSSQKVIDAFGAASGRQQLHLMGAEHIETIQKVKLAAAKPIHWLKALADINLHFTSYVVDLQRSIAYLDGMAQAGKHGVTDEFGNPVEMTKERMAAEGMHHAERVMGDLRRMSPFERNVARSVMPFYGWQKHILKYVMSFPGDHPWRAMMLANMAEYDTSHTPAGLPSRYQFLFFLGHPDEQGNVTALDVRAMNPLRDVANYATWGGIIGGLNPVITAGFSAVDPSITFGGNQLYPHLTYDQFYGIETAGPQGNLVTAASAVVPQIGGIKSALGLMGARQGMNTSTLVKSLGNQLNFPWIPQSINLKQEAAKTAIAQYQVTKSLAQTAWQSGDFGPIADLGTVPDPRNPQYETPVSALQSLYDTLSKEYPGVPPEAAATPLPSLHL